METIYGPAQRNTRQEPSRVVEIWRDGQFANSLCLTDAELQDMGAAFDGRTDYGTERWIVPDKEIKMETYRIYAKSYPGTGRPDQFIAFAPAEGEPKGDYVYQGELSANSDREAEQLAWQTWTVKEEDGFIYWK